MAQSVLPGTGAYRPAAHSVQLGPSCHLPAGQGEQASADCAPLTVPGAQGLHCRGAGGSPSNLSPVSQQGVPLCAGGSGPTQYVATAAGSGHAKKFPRTSHGPLLLTVGTRMSGKMPRSRLFCILKYSRRFTDDILATDHDRGTVPSMRLSFTSKSVSSGREPQDSGSVPPISFCESSTCIRFGPPGSPQALGRVPPRRFSARLMFCSARSDFHSGGKLPESSFSWP